MARGVRGGPRGGIGGWSASEGPGCVRHGEQLARGDRRMAPQASRACGEGNGHEKETAESGQHRISRDGADRHGPRVDRSAAVRPPPRSDPPPVHSREQQDRE